MPGVKVRPPIRPELRLILEMSRLTRPAASRYAVPMSPTATVKTPGVGTA